jgi:diguanylate cyclase (GGDEF)-like protein
MNATQTEDNGAVHADRSPLQGAADKHRSTPLSPGLTAIAAYGFAAVLSLITALLLFRGPLHGVQPVRILIPLPAMFVVVSSLWTATLWAPIPLHHRGNTSLVVLEEVPMLLGLAFLTPQLLVLACLVASGITFLILSRQAIVKAAGNLAAGAFSTAIAALVYRALLGSHDPVSIRGWGAAAVALITSVVVTNLMIPIWTKIHGQTTERLTGPQIGTNAMISAASVCLGFVVLDAAWVNLWATIPVLLVAALVILAYRGYARLSLRFASLQRLYDFSHAVGAANLEPSSMTVEVLRQVCTVMRARRALVVFAEPTGIPRRVTLSEDGASGVEPIALDATSIVTLALETGQPSLYPTNTGQTHGMSHDPIADEFSVAMVAPINGDNAPIGAIVALDRDEQLDEFDEDDLRLFETLVAHASVNLERARLVEDLYFEAEKNKYQATHDLLTGLPNRMLFLTRAQTALNDGAGVAIILLDLNRFKDVNDTLGHAIGDRLLVEVTDRLQRAASERTTIARLGGDEFAFVVADVTEPAQAIAAANQLHSALSKPIDIDGLTLAVTASSGIALAPRHGDDVAVLLQRADIAMYLAKERRSTVELYSVEHDQSMQRRITLGGLLTDAIENKNELSVVYHAIADVRSRRVVFVEALARWNHPVHGPIPPDEFIGIAEQMGTISQITDFVLAESCEQLADWRKAGLNLGVAINISGRELAQSSLVERVRQQLRAYDLPPDTLTLEVTETEVMADLQQATRVLDDLAALGIRIAVDDYGTGYSSLAYIHRLPLQELKIDRSFVTNLPNEPSNRIIVRSSIAMAHSLGLTVVAEGAEDSITCALLAEAGCDLIQGYHLSKPMGPGELKEWLLSGASLEFEPLASLPTADNRDVLLAQHGTSLRLN